MSGFNVTALHHASLVVSDTEVSLKFYRDLLGLEVDDGRPDLGHPGAWLNIGASQIHLLELPNPDPVEGRPEHGGRDRHVALTVEGVDAVIERLEASGMEYTRSRSGRKAAFCRDPDGNAIELIGR